MVDRQADKQTSKNALHTHMYVQAKCSLFHGRQMGWQKTELQMH